MSKGLVVVEGYDGSGKTSLIRAAFQGTEAQGIRVIGRRTEPELLPLTRLLDSEERQFTCETEVALRFALEIERLSLVRVALSRDELVVLDRGVPSLVSWLDYYELDARPYEALAESLSNIYQGSLLVVCTADFDTCWSRVARRPTPSRKERLGEAVNRRFHRQFTRVLDRLSDSYEVLRLDTATRSLAECVTDLRSELAMRGVFVR